MTVGAVVAAAGRGERLGADVAKALVHVSGRPLVVHAVAALREAGVRDIVACAPADEVARFAELLVGVRVVAGGATRSASVRLGLAELSASVDVVLVHDAARAFMPASVIGAVAAAVAHADAVVPVLAVADTVKQVDAAGVVVRTVDRSQLRAAQTPQGFRRHMLESAHAAVTDSEATDDAALVEAAGGRVVTVPGSPYGMKVTTAFDLAVIEALLRERVSP